MTIEELEEKIKKIETQIGELKNTVLSHQSSFADVNNAINRLSDRISDIENNGIKTAVGDLREDVNAQRLKINKLDRVRRGLT